jgi:membrane protease YdiL (CAAX protease family)
MDFTNLNSHPPIDPQSRISLPTRLVVLFALVLPSLVTIAYFELASTFSPGVQQAVFSIGKGLQFALPVLCVFLIQRESLSWQRPSVSGVAMSVGFGLVVVAAMLLLYFGWLKSSPLFATATEPIREKVASMGVATPLRFITLGVFYALIHSLLEEYYWRWFVFRLLGRWLPISAAIAVSSAGFMAHHVMLLAHYFGWTSPATWIFSLAVAIGGAVWAWLYHRHGSLVGPWLSHLLVDAGIFIIGFDVVFGL